MSAIERAERELAETYRTPAQRAAYRAGLSTAFGICDEFSADFGSKPRWRNGDVSAKGVVGALVAKMCGDAIEKLYRSIRVYETDGVNRSATTEQGNAIEAAEHSLEREFRKQMEWEAGK